MDYDAIKAINFSSLKQLAVSPLMYRWRIDHQEPEKQVYVIGGAIHCLLFEPGKFDARFGVFEGTRRGKAWDEWLLENPGKRSLKPAELATIKATVEAIRRHRKAAEIIAACRFEEATTWTDPETGLECKGRIDAIGPYIVELKSTKDILPRVFKRQSAALIYHGQLAWYHDGAVLAGKISGEQLPWLIAAEKLPPNDIGPYRMTSDSLAVGREVYRSLLTLLVRCTEANFWPGKVPDVEPLDIPPYMKGVIQLDEEEDF